MSSLCCIGLTIASRMIGTFTLAFSILMINVFSSYLVTKTHEKDFLLTLESWVPVGLGWTIVFKYLHFNDECQNIIVICSAVIAYSTIFFIASGCLAYGSIVRKSKCAVGWLYMETFSIIDQLVSLGTLLIREGYDVFNKYTWYTSLCCIYVLLNIYFWIVVDNARKEWRKSSENQILHDDETNENVIVNQVTVKTPSYVSTSLMTNQQQSAFQQINDLPTYDSLSNIT